MFVLIAYGTKLAPMWLSVMSVFSAGEKKKKKIEGETPASFLSLKYEFFFFFFFLGLPLRHMEVPRLGAELELLLPAYAIATAMQDPSSHPATCATAQDNAGSLTH